METITVCPLGSECETIKDNKIHKCAWYTELKGVNPQTGEETNDKGCSMAWAPILLIENAREIKSLAAAVESSRNVFVDSITKGEA